MDLQAVKTTKEAINDIKKRTFTVSEVPYLLANVTSDIPYIGNCCKNNRTSLKRGQRKLCISLMYFLTKYGQDSDTVIYVGSAPGFNISAVAEMFPKITFRLYDPKKTYTKKTLSNIIIELDNSKPGSNEGKKFTIEEAERFYPHRSRTLFFCDLRTTDKKGAVTEKVVTNDMNFQLELLRKMKPRAFCLKFRIPFTNESGRKTGIFKYPAGFVFIQPWAPQTTTETRLMFETENCLDGKGNYILQDYSLIEHENAAFYINTVAREFGRYLTKPIPFGDQCYDCALEEHYCNEYCKSQFNKQFKSAADLRQWIDKYHAKLALKATPNVKFGEYTQEIVHLLGDQKQVVNDDGSTAYFHGQLPLQKRDINEFLRIIDPIEPFVRVCTERAGLNPSETKDLRKYFMKHINDVLEAITHKSVDAVNNYEIFEFRGDTILDDFVSGFFMDYTRRNKYRDVSILTGLKAAIISGETATILFAEKFHIRDVIRINDEENFEKALEDVVEAFLTVIMLVGDEEFGDGCGHMMCKRIIYSILSEIDFYNYQDKIFPPKTKLKEFYNDSSKKALGWGDFEKNYTVSISDTRTKKTDFVDWIPNLITVKLTLPPEFSYAEPPQFEMFGTKRDVERAFAIAALQFMENRGFPTTPSEKKLDTIFKAPKVINLAPSSTSS